MDAGAPRAIIEPFAARLMAVVVVVMMMVVVRMVVIMGVIMVMRVIMGMGVNMVAMGVDMAMRVFVPGRDPGIAFGLFALHFFVFLGRRSAAANRAHYSTSSSLTRISSPAVI
jgi:hypothetical protein